MADFVDIVYYTDPLCCWSWAMEDHWVKFIQNYGHRVRFRYCMGGLISSWNNYHDSVHSISRPGQMGPLWMQAGQQTGATFNPRIWVDDPPASSYLACVAVKSASLQSAQAEHLYLHALREAVMVRGINIAFESRLLQIADEIQTAYPALLDNNLFADDLRNGNGLDAFRKDLSEVQQRQINRFPTLVLRSAPRQGLLVTGYRSYEQLEALVDGLVRSEATGQRQP